MVNNRKRSPDSFAHIARLITQAKLAALIGGQTANNLDGLKLHSATLDPEHIGRVRFSWRSPDYVEGQDG